MRIEQEPPLTVAPVAEDRFEIRFREQAYWDPPEATLDFVRGHDGAVAGFLLSSGSEKNIGFEKRQ